MSPKAKSLKYFDFKSHRFLLVEVARNCCGLSSLLPHFPSKYFETARNARLTPTKLIAPTRARPTGICNARYYMGAAAAGKRPRRQPIKIIRFKSGHYNFLCIDGNSTLINAKYAGWPTIPCEVSETSLDAIVELMSRSERPLRLNTEQARAD